MDVSMKSPGVEFDLKENLLHVYLCMLFYFSASPDVVYFT